MDPKILREAFDRLTRIEEGKYPDMNALYEEPEDSNTDQIAAISQLIADRTEDENVPSKLSTEAFIGLVNKMGIPLTNQTLMDLAEKGNLSGVIKDVNLEEIHFRGQSEIDPTDMTVDKAKDVVARMAKRSAKKSLR